MDVDVLFAGVAVTEFEEATSALDARGVATGPIKPEGEAGLKSVVRDPAHHSIEIIDVAGGDS